MDQKGLNNLTADELRLKLATALNLPIQAVENLMIQVTGITDRTELQNFDFSLTPQQVRDAAKKDQIINN